MGLPRVGGTKNVGGANHARVMRNAHDADYLLKFRLKYRPLEDASMAGEWLWGRWLDRKRGLVVAQNNAVEVPLLVADTVRVARDPEGGWRMVEAVRLAEFMATWTTFDKPVTTEEAQEVYDGWVRDGYAVHTEGGSRVMVTAWQESMSMEQVLAVLGPTFVNEGWRLWQVFTPADRLSEIQHRVDLRSPSVKTRS
ncbi:hypothetical protein H5399_04820 [Tessaracoccus sp. MC1627]|uniref:hypothetical protein n=1 Tax=Tessaracoccus sp. MC1627 TaxID=2760312 RepID=UPI0016048B87|nr:hypothetical protein [Tessaracoccus sp. MC1627]MBB1511926.1 hypothetical protein [Tessaracoccus sp. MC1627]